MSDVFRTEGLTRRFSGFVAVNEVTLAIPEGGVRAIIGPNGAGKTTFFDLLSGLLAPSEGKVFFRDRDVTALAPHERARLGIARSFQITNVFGRLRVLENVRLAVQAVRDGKANFFLPLANAKEVRATAERILADVGLTHAHGERAENLSHGDQRRLEIGLVLAADPAVLLLDEPLAGMSPAETQATVELIRRIAAGRTILLVEHDIDVVMELSTSIVVLQSGRVLATGTPEEIRADEAVRKAYLGDTA